MKSRVAILLLSLLRRLWRYRVVGVVPERGVLAFWHGLMLPVWAYFAGRGAVALVSRSRDGELLARLLERWGYRCVRGSSSRGGKEALEELIAAARAGSLVMLTPDGPRGPRGVVKRGAVLCAAAAQVPLVWCSVRCTFAHRFERSWDRFLLPLPGATVELEFSPPLVVPQHLSDAEVVAWCQRLQQQYAQ